MPQSPPLAKPTADLLDALARVVGLAYALRDAASQAPYLREWRDRYNGRTRLVLRPGSVAEISEILKLCNAARVGVVPQAGNTGLVGGQIPYATGDEIVVSVGRLNRVLSLDAAASSLTVEAGVTLAAARTAAAGASRLFPLSMASEGSCCIGGNLATNAGGIAVLAHGTARNLVLGLEVVLADGRVWSSLKSLKKDNTGYDLRDLFIGSEGTLGIITAATLKLVPQPAETATAFVAMTSLAALIPLFRLAETHAGPFLTAFEFMSERAVEFTAKHGRGSRIPVGGRAPYYALLEISAPDLGRAAPLLEKILSTALEKNLATDASLAASLTQQRDYWRLREQMSEVQKFEGGSIKHDISLPLAAISEFLEKAEGIVQQVCPGARPVPFGHLGDGNIHYNVSQPVDGDKAQFLTQWDALSQAIHGLVVEMGGSISAEHGIGRMKREELQLVKSDVEMDLMHSIKAALDPNGILNPGKLL